MNFWQIHYTTAENPSLYFMINLLMVCETAVSHNEFANSHSHINGIESFWAFAKIRLSRLRGVQKHVFYFHLKECEFRFNHRREDIAKIILNLLKNDPLG